MSGIELLNMVSDIGSMMIECGAEIYRAEETIDRITLAYGYSAEVFIIPTSLIITINSAGTPLTKAMRIKARHTNLDRVDKLNNLSRFICVQKPDAAEINRHIEAIRQRSVYGFTLKLISYYAVGGTFAIFFGGGFMDAVFAGVAAVLIILMEMAIERVRPSTFFRCVVCSLMTASLAIVVTRLGLTESFDKIIIGASMTMVPGITITNCMRDFIAGDFLAGLYTLTEAIIVAVGMAIGSVSAIAVLTV
ncbi:MAG: threonine/serine exporter family protein [Oscillospiraceae bacterium]|nr:threonine/serine exporter family protein [Oscillospiraceae bacterium]